MAVGHGGQVLLSSAAAALAADRLPEGARLRDLGVHRLKDLGRPERLFQLLHQDLADGFPPLATLDRCPNDLSTQTSTFAGRDAELVQELTGRLRVQLFVDRAQAVKADFRLTEENADDVADTPNGRQLDTGQRSSSVPRRRATRLVCS